MIKLRNGLTIGQGGPVRINCNIGCNSAEGYDLEIQKIEAIKMSGLVPDIMMDLSLVRMPKPLYQVAHEELGVEVGTVLSYIPFSKSKGLDWKKCKQLLIELCENGISFVTIHFTASMQLYEQAKSIRKVPVTSRGGALCLYDQRLNNCFNVFTSHIDEIADMVKKYDVAISLGTTFRPANIFDACDEIHILETQEQLRLCKYLQGKGVKVMVENIGHISLDKLARHSILLHEFDAPIMPLGPLPVDSAVGVDHINNAIGASLAAYWECAHVINCVTRYEHSCGSISIDALIEGISAARLAAHAANVSKGFELDEEKEIDRIRESSHSCIIDGSECGRCSDFCPLKLI